MRYYPVGTLIYYDATMSSRFIFGIVVGCNRKNNEIQIYWTDIGYVPNTSSFLNKNKFIQILFKTR